MLEAFVYDTLDAGDDEECDDEGAIEGRGVEDLLSAICTIGRVNLNASLCIVSSHLRSNLTQTQEMVGSNVSEAQLSSGGIGSATALRNLETSRICLLFTSYLLIDTFQYDASGSENDATTSLSGGLCKSRSEPTGEGKDSYWLRL